jgi:hypothetical protein
VTLQIVASLTIIIYDHNSFIIQATGLTGKRSSLFTAAVPGRETGVGLLEGLLPTVEHRNSATDPEVQEQEDDQGGQAGRRQRVELKKPSDCQEFSGKWQHLRSRNTIRPSIYLEYTLFNLKDPEIFFFSSISSRFTTGLQHNKSSYEISLITNCFSSF